MYAVFESGGKQHRVTEGEVVRLESLPGQVGDRVVFERVLLVADGAQLTVGKPVLVGSQVSGEVVAQGRGKKVNVIKFKRRKNYLRRKGHRQAYTDVKITAISWADSESSGSESVALAAAES